MEVLTLIAVILHIALGNRDDAGVGGWDGRIVVRGVEEEVLEELVRVVLADHYAGLSPSNPNVIRKQKSGTKKHYVSARNKTSGRRGKERDAYGLDDIPHVIHEFLALLGELGLVDGGVVEDVGEGLVDLDVVGVLVLPHRLDHAV